MKRFWILASCALLIVAGCGGVADVSSSNGPTTLPLVDATDTDATDTGGADTDGADTGGAGTDAAAQRGAPSTSEQREATATPASTTVPLSDPSETGAPASTTQASDSTEHPISPPAGPAHGEYCAASASITALGTFVGFGDPAATEDYFTAQDVGWAGAAAVAPEVIASDVARVAAFVSQLLVLLADNEYDIGAVIAEAGALEASSGSDNARIRVDQFSFISCGVEPPSAEQQTAVFYVGLLDTPQRRAVLAELLAAEEIFELIGASCFVEVATPESMFPLAGADSTPEQDTALERVLSSCQLSISS